jgi:ribonuclease J
MGMPAERVFLLEDGDVLELTESHGRVAARVPAGRVLVDGKGVGDVGDTVLRDRQHLAQDGMVVVVVGIDKGGTIIVGPDIISRGFADLPEGDALFEGARKLIVEVLEGCGSDEKTDWALVKQRIRSALRKFIQKAVERRPMILPLIIEI